VDLLWVVAGIIVLPIPIGLLWLVVYRARRTLGLPDWLSGILARGIISGHRIVSGTAQSRDYNFFATGMGGLLIVCLVGIGILGPVVSGQVSSWLSPRDAVQIDNYLSLPILVTVGGQAGIEVPPSGSTSIALLGQNSLGWRVEQPIGPGGAPMGDDMGAAWVGLTGGSQVIIDNHVVDSFYLAPVLTITLKTECSVVINEGLPDQNDPGLQVGPGTANLMLGYYRYWSNSNVTAHCDNGMRYRWGTDGPPIKVADHSGEYDIVIDR
jgi:hypothetical protein